MSLLFEYYSLYARGPLFLSNHLAKVTNMMKVIAVTVPEQMHSQMRREADENGSNVSAVFRSYFQEVHGPRRKKSRPGEQDLFEQPVKKAARKAPQSTQLDIVGAAE